MEAKREHELPGDGLKQGKRYAQMLRLPRAYSTKGTGIVEHDYDTGVETNLDAFPSPESMLERYHAWKGLVEPAAVGILLALQPLLPLSVSRISLM